MKEHVRKDSRTPRRGFLKVAAFSAGALAASPLLDRAAPRAEAAPANEHGELHLPFGPTSLRNAGELSLVTSKVIPASQALPFDKFLESPGFALDTTVEPNPKPFAISQFNPMVVSGALSGLNVPEGFRVDTLVTNRLIQYTAAELQGAYVRPLVPGVSAC